MRAAAIFGPRVGRPQVIALGLVFGKDAYLKSAWNILDFFIVLISFLLLVASI